MNSPFNNYYPKSITDKIYNMNSVLQYKYLLYSYIY